MAVWWGGEWRQDEIGGGGVGRLKVKRGGEFGDGRRRRRRRMGCKGYRGCVVNVGVRR